jgi:hypothetical protein
LRLGFRDDCEDFEGFVRDVMEHPDLSDPEAELRFAHATKSLDAALACLSGLVAQVRFDRLLDLGTPVRSQDLRRPCASRGQNDLGSYTGQNSGRRSPPNMALRQTGEPRPANAAAGASGMLATVPSGWAGS